MAARYHVHMALAVALFSSLAALAWLSAAVHAVLLVPHRRPDVTVGQLVVGGHRFFSADTFSQSGSSLHRRFMQSTLVFAGSLLALIVTSLLASRG